MTIVVLTIVIASTILINFLRKEEIKRVDILVSALKFQQEVETPSLEIQELLLQIYSSNTTIPVIILDKNNQIMVHKNISPDIEDVKAVATGILRHRIIKNYKADAEGITEEMIIESLL